MKEIHLTFTQADRGHLLRTIGRTFPAPRGVDLFPEHGAAILRFDDDDLDAVNEWAKLTTATVVHGGHTYDADGDRPWHEFGTRPGGKRGYWAGWALDLWCKVSGPAPGVVEGDAAGGAALPGPAADGPPDAAGPGPIPWEHTPRTSTDGLPVDLTPDHDECCEEPSPRVGYLCTLPAGHKRSHRAGNGLVILAEWGPNVPPPVQALEAE